MLLKKGSPIIVEKIWLVNVLHCFCSLYNFNRIDGKNGDWISLCAVQRINFFKIRQEQIPKREVKRRVVRGSHSPQALTDPDMSLSTHPAPIVQPEAAYPISANGQTIEADEELNVLTSELLSVGTLSYP